MNADLTLTTQLHVKIDALSTTRWHSAPAAPLAAGECRLRVDCFALTANNMTYAAFGEAMHYWQFFPTHEAGWGIVPVWGFGTVLESQADGVVVGETFYGYYPMANQVVLSPMRISAKGFSDGAPHRTALHTVYNQYHLCSADPFHTPSGDAVEVLLRPLFVTSWLIDDFFTDQNYFSADTAVLSSASSKTAYGTAHLMKQAGKVRVVGLTSPANVAFCESLGCYDTVLTYAQLDHIAPQTRCVYVDFAGNAALRKAIHIRFEHLAYSCAIGGTHLGALGGARGLPGSKTELFFAPAQSQKRLKDWGCTVFGQRMVAAWQAFTTVVTQANPPWLVPERHHGADAVAAAYQTVLAGKGDARVGHVLGFGPDAFG